VERAFFLDRHANSRGIEWDLRRGRERERNRWAERVLEGVGMGLFDCLICFGH
jgi:hypothetical protein